MSELEQVALESLQRSAATAIHRHWVLFLVPGLVMMGLGLCAVVLPQLATLAVEILIGWLLVAGGLIRAAALLRHRGAPGFWWALPTAVLAAVLGFSLLVKPTAGVLTLTTVLLALFVVEGVAALLLALDVRRHLSNWGWFAMSGVVDLVLAGLIWRGWPATADWAVGLLVGVNMFVLGMSLALTALAARAPAPGR